MSLLTRLGKVPLSTERSLGNLWRLILDSSDVNGGVVNESVINNDIVNDSIVNDGILFKELLISNFSLLI